AEGGVGAGMRSGGTCDATQPKPSGMVLVSPHFECLPPAPISTSTGIGAQGQYARFLADAAHARSRIRTIRTTNSRWECGSRAVEDQARLRCHRARRTEKVVRR